MIVIHTRQSENGNWWCSGTVLGADESFEHRFDSGAQVAMVNFLKRNGVDMQKVKWNKSITYHEQVKNNIGLHSLIAPATRLDEKGFD